MNLLRTVIFINKEYYICLNCSVALNTNFQQNDKKWQFSIKLCEKVRVVTCSFYSFGDEFLDEIMHV